MYTLYCREILKKLCLVYTLFFQVVKIVQTDPKDKDSEFESFVFWVFLHDSNDLKDPVWARLQEKLLLSAKIVRKIFFFIFFPFYINRAFIIEVVD